MNEQMNAAKRDLDTLIHQMKGYPPRRMAVAVWEWMRAQGFEQAHTPTDDEREAIINALLDELGWEWDEVPEEHIPSSREILGDMADRVLAVTADFRRPVQGEPTDAERDAEAKRIWPVDREYSPQQTRAVFSVKELDAYCVSAFTRGAKWAAGFRRTAVQEPSAEEVDESAPRYQPCHFDTSGMYARTWCHTHGYDHLTPDGDVYVQGFDLGDGKTYTGPISQEDLFGVEPQSEPTDAQAWAAARAVADLRKRETGTPAWFNVDHARAALRAAAAVREEGQGHG